MTLDGLWWRHCLGRSAHRTSDRVNTRLGRAPGAPKASGASNLILRGWQTRLPQCPCPVTAPPNTARSAGRTRRVLMLFHWSFSHRYRSAWAAPPRSSPNVPISSRSQLHAGSRNDSRSAATFRPPASPAYGGRDRTASSSPRDQLVDITKQRSRMERD
jgi:hypothetical protein